MDTGIRTTRRIRNIALAIALVLTVVVAVLILNVVIGH